MRAKKKLVLLILFAVFVLIPSIVLFSVSFASLQATEVGLDYNHNTKHVDSKLYQNGLYMLGLGHSFIKFPTTLQTMDFEGSSQVTCFTSDGLPVTLSLSFQYKLVPSSVHDLYMTFGLDYETVYKNYALHQIAEGSTMFTAYQFFNEPSAIGSYLLKNIQESFTTLYATVEYLQLKSVGLPAVFEDAIQDTIVAEQQIQKAGYQLDTATVLASTMVQNATYAANITLINAAAEATNYLQTQQANALATANLIGIEAISYAAVMSDLQFESADQLLDYIWLEALSEQDHAELFIGFPATPVLGVKN
jgi:hypothetical protein